MQIKEFEAQTLKECLQLVRNAMGPDAIILETRKFRKGGVMGLGAQDAIAIVAATGITVDSDRQGSASDPSERKREPSGVHPQPQTASVESDLAGSSQAVPARSAAANVAARGVYGRAIAEAGNGRPTISGAGPERDPYAELLADPTPNYLTERMRQLAAASRPTVPPVSANQEAGLRELKSPGGHSANGIASVGPASSRIESTPPPIESIADCQANDPVDRSPSSIEDRRRLAYLERAMGEIRECLITLQREHSDGVDRTVSAVVSAVAPAVTAVTAAGFAAYATDLEGRFPDLQAAVRSAGVSAELVDELFDQLPDMGAWSPKAQEALAISAIRDLIARRIATVNSIELTPGRPKVVALIGPTGVGKTTTVAKLAANFALLQRKRVALITVDTYRIAAVEQLKTYSQIIGLPVSVAYSHEELPNILELYSDYDLVLIDTAGRSQRHASQIEELKALVETVECEAHLVLAASTNELDMLDAARRFSGARVDRLIFSKLDETSRYGVLLNVSDQTGIPLSFLTTGQKVPEDIEAAEGTKVADLILSDCAQSASLTMAPSSR